MTPQDLPDEGMWSYIQGNLAMIVDTGWAQAQAQMEWYEGEVPTSFTSGQDYHDFALAISNAWHEAHPTE